MIPGRRRCQNAVMGNDSSSGPGSAGGSILSIGSSGSILSIGSAGSLAAIGSFASLGSFASAFSIGSIWSFASVASGFSARALKGWGDPKGSWARLSRRTPARVRSVK